MSATPDYPDADHAVFSGPFHGLPPLDLWRLFTALPDGGFRSGDDVRTSSEAWLRTMLEKAGVELSDYDQAVIAFLAEDVTTVQVIAGWIRRAHRNGMVCSETSGPPPTRTRFTG
ncbi:MAG: hypothetical protein JOY78_02485 [Pseudonocardia sp.]|nr:hypothetical protein [Pseudonocardia sp.]